MKTTTDNICITDLTDSQILELMVEWGKPVYRAKQLRSWVYQRLADSFDEMTELPEPLRQKLTQQTRLHSLTPKHEVVGKDGTAKTLFTLADGKTIESTLMPYPAEEPARHTLCVSTQVGCPIGCPFCATGQQGFERNLTPGEIVDQVLYFARQLREQQNSVTNLVFMGMGEPLANYDNLLQAIGMLNSPDGFGLGARHITISTAGLVPQIKRLSLEKLQVGLAVSLHASDNSLRNKLVPINKKYPLEVLIPACQEYFKETGRRASFEYALFKGINDSVRHARSLARLVGDSDCHINLIRANHTTNQAFQPSVSGIVTAFEKELKRLGVACTLRQPRGLDIDAGCGQLRSRFITG